MPSFRHDLKTNSMISTSPKVLKEAKAREFMDLVPGSMTVAQYGAKFTELSRFAMYLILGKEKKVRKFEKGLNQRIQNQVVSLEVNKFVDVVNKASFVDEWVQKSLALATNERKKQFSQVSQLG